MKVVVCEDDPKHRQMLTSIIQNYAMFYDTSIEIVLTASTPDEVLNYLELNQAECFFFDIEFNTAMNGIELATKIREKDPLAHIIFVTTHADKWKLTFTYKLAALDFIVKGKYDRLRKEVTEALQVASYKYVQLGKTNELDMFQIKVGEKIRNIPLHQIYFFETSQQTHKIIMHEKNGRHEFYGKIKDIESHHELFFQCHKSFIVNIMQIKEFNKKERELLMNNGMRCPVSSRMIKQLLLYIQSPNYNIRIDYVSL